MHSKARYKKLPADLFGDRFRSREHLLSPRLHAVASYINQHRQVIMENTALEIAAATQTSDATVVRAIQALGFAGLRDLKRTLENLHGPVLSSAQKLTTTVRTLSYDVDSSIDFVIEGHRRGCDVLAEKDNRLAMAQAVELLMAAGRVGVFGIGASSLLADYAARLLNRIGTPAYPLNRTGVALAEQLIAIKRGDVLIMMAQNNAHREGRATLREARRLGVPVILLTWAGGSQFAREAHTVILVPRGGEGGKVPLHGTVLVCLEMIILSLASAAPQVSIKSMDRLQGLYQAIMGGARSAGK
ncbi:MurR/RpiR family transcriptional regulator [Acerihabitans arboris]|uniref:SIS domain-containing protein n=1 Tax=Acerihabitans arboris TaxID=2691583 RepID=A0A845SEY4_9GAMM|nr:MurR/RpiR family transcriptional regulator [Acerihabitans arboris]NDL63360.1 SIS domain-containing protein [Acerihabitans arboris]